MDLELLTAITDLARALAWPIVALLGLWWFKPEVRGLLGRFRRAAGLEFYPPTTQSGSVTVTTATGLSPDLVLSPSAAAVVAELRAIPDFQKASDARRIELLLHATAWLQVIVNFEQIESVIWGSQIALLEHLNALGGGDSFANLKTRFYDPAAARHAPMFAGYLFDAYLGFLRGNELIETDGGVARITQRGRDYLAWRVQARKAPKSFG
jgi:hypothetical protein